MTLPFPTRLPYSLSQGLGDRTAVHVCHHERFPVFKEAGSLARNHSVEAPLVQLHRQAACESGCKRPQIFRMRIRLCLDRAHERIQTGAVERSLVKRLDRTYELPGSRSEEHTSELQSLMRISYAVFCLKQNK